VPLCISNIHEVVTVGEMTNDIRICEKLEAGLSLLQGKGRDEAGGWCKCLGHGSLRKSYFALTLPLP